MQKHILYKHVFCLEMMQGSEKKNLTLALFI